LHTPVLSFAHLSLNDRDRAVAVMRSVAPVAGFGDIYPGTEAWIELHLTPGRYFIVCQVQAKADGRPHYKHGMFTEFSIE
jgi:hypothetical protein